MTKVDQNYFPTISWETFINKDETLLNKSLTEGAQKGGFYLEMSKIGKEFLEDAFKWAQTFSTDVERKKFKEEGTRQGFMQVDSMQYEAFMLFKRNWKELPSDGCRAFANEMHKTSVEVLKKILKLSGIEEKDWDKATNGATNYEGIARFNVQYYDPNKKEKPGLPKHTDAGFLTFVKPLVTEALDGKGLFAETTDGSSVEVLPQEGEVFVHLGDAAAKLFNSPDYKAVKHEVTSVTTHRFSLAFFVDPKPENLLYTRDPKTGELIQTDQTFAAFLEEKRKNLGFVTQKK